MGTLRKIVRNYKCLRGIHILNDKDENKLFDLSEHDPCLLETRCKYCGEPLVASRIFDVSRKKVYRIEEKRQEWWYEVDLDPDNDDVSPESPSFTYFDPQTMDVDEILQKLKKLGLRLKMIKSVNPTYDELTGLVEGLKKMGIKIPFNI